MEKYLKRALESCNSLKNFVEILNKSLYYETKGTVFSLIIKGKNRANKGDN